MTESIPPQQPWTALNGNSGSAGAGAGQDFVLFDENASAAASASTPSILSIAQQQQQQPFGAMMMQGGNNVSTPRSGAFTEYRNSVQQAGAIPGGGGSSNSINESPFSSPASRPSDDFTSIASGNTAGAGWAGTASSTAGTAIPISASDAPYSGTLSQGAPKPKRARAHGYSSSWTGGNLEKHMQQLQQGTNQGQHAPGSSSMMPTTSFGGFPSAASGSDWSGSDTSPQNPPSGSFGPPIHSLSLGDRGSPPDAAGLSNGQLSSLFPTGNAAADQAAIQAVLAASSGGMLTPFQSSMQQQQEDRARQQIRADLVGVDSRALKGQLRDIQQGSAPTSFPSFDTMTAQGNILFPNVPQTPLGNEMVSQGSLFESTTAPGGGAGSTSVGGGDASATMPASAQVPTGMTAVPQSFAAPVPGSDHTSPSGVQQQNTALHRPLDPPPQPTRQLSERTQQAVDRARAQKPTRKRLTRDYSGTTVSPQEAFLDFQDIDSVLRSSRQADATPNVFASNATAASIPALNNTSTSSFAAASAPMSFGLGMSNSIGGGASTPRPANDVPLSTASATHEGTPSLVDGGSSGSNSRATSSIPSPSQRAPLNRGETVRPTKAQQEAAAAASSQPSSQNSSAVFARSDLDMLSPADSVTNSTDDEDEKPYAPNREMKDARAVSTSMPDVLAGAANQRQSAGPSNFQGHVPTFGAQHGGAGGGPRFSVVSSSSSESEDEDRRISGSRRTGNPQSMHLGASRPRTMGGYGYMGSSEESGLTTASTPSAPPPSQQMASLGHSDGVAGPPFGMINTHGSHGPFATQMPAMFMPPSLDTAAAQNAANQPFAQQQPSSGDAPSEGGSQSYDEGPRISPSIRSSAQAIYPNQGGGGHSMPNLFGMHSMLPSAVPTAQHMPFGHHNAAPYGTQHPSSNQQYQGRARPGGQDMSMPAAAARRTKARGPSTKTGRKSTGGDDDDDDDDDDEEGDDDGDESSDDWDASADESEGSAYHQSASASKPAKSRKSGGTAQRRRSLADTSGGSANSGAAGTASTVTVCDYVSPMTGEECGTVFHRPYDLARHRETIHAREESTLLKQGKITREQCVVLYKEVDPAKSLATVEWRCDGDRGCGALFSRKDALLRHRRIRNH